MEVCNAKLQVQPELASGTNNKPPAGIILIQQPGRLTCVTRESIWSLRSNITAFESRNKKAFADAETLPQPCRCPLPRRETYEASSSLGAFNFCPDFNGECSLWQGLNPSWRLLDPHPRYRFGPFPVECVGRLGRKIGLANNRCHGRAIAEGEPIPSIKRTTGELPGGERSRWGHMASFF